MGVSRIARVHNRATFAKASQLWLLLLPMPSEIASTTARPCLVAGEQCTYHHDETAHCALLYALLRFALQKHFIDESVCIACCCHGSRVLCTCLIFRVYGEAYMLVNSETGKKVVVKHVPLDCLDEDEIKLALSEVEALQTLDHPNIVRCLGSWVMPPGDDAVRPWSSGAEGARLPAHEILRVVAEFEDGSLDHASVPSLNILTEFVDGGALDTLIRGNAPLDEDLVGAWLAQMILGIEHMHSRNLLHRDIKPANIFITQSGLVKIGDLGCCKLLAEPNEQCSGDYGSPLYLSPEVWRAATCSHKSDIWSIGCVIYELLAQVPPFAAPELAYKVITDPPPPLPEEYSAGLRKIVFSMLEKDPAKRPSAAELLRMPAVGQHVKRWLAAGFTTVAE